MVRLARGHGRSYKLTRLAIGDTKEKISAINLDEEYV